MTSLNSASPPHGAQTPSMTLFDVPDARYTLGICVMERKARSAPMLEILGRLPSELFRVEFFGDETILHQPVAAWPHCDALIAFFSKGFPLRKVQDYVALRQPVVVNDLDTQYLLQDRREVYRVLQEHGVPTPRYVFVNCDGYGGQTEPPEVIEGDDFIQVDGVRINKPFVEKPVDGEDHNIHIYYPMSAGGGCKRLFRKVGNRSSEYDPQLNSVRTGGSYIYEEFLSTQGTDVKVYTVGPHYAHAEARKSPVLDGRVVRDADGKEVRYPVMLSTEEKQIAYRVCRAFKQTICGFDILRVRDASYVCDVNGWSFVKNSEKYYDDCGILLTQYLEQALASGGAMAGEDFGTDSSAFSSVTFRFAPDAPPPSAELSEPPTAHRHAMLRGPSTSIAESEVSEPDSITDGNEDTLYQEEELRCVLAVIRHGDRTPKQKMKMNVCHPAFLQFYEDRLRESMQENGDGNDSKKKKKMDLKIKAVANLERLLQVSKDLLHKYENRDPAFMDFLEQREVKCGEDATDRVKGYRTLRDVLQRWQLVGINRKVQLKPKEFVTAPVEGTDENGEQLTIRRVSKLLLIIKWGGDLTHTGEEQAEHLGQKFRRMMYPGGAGGLNRLHSTYRHDLKIYTSDEGRVQKTAASFAKGLLELEGDIIPILVGLVLKSKDADSMLDQSGSSAQEIIMRVKQRLHKIIHREDHCSQLIDSNSRLIRSVALALIKVDQPIKKMGIMHKLLQSLKEQLTRMIQEKAKYKTEIDRWQQKKATAGRLLAPVMGRSASVNELSQSRSRHVHSYAPRKKHSEGSNISSDAANSSVGLRKMRLQEPLSPEEIKYPEPCGRETLEVMRERWAKLYRDFYVKKRDTYDLSKIPDIHDCIRYDAVHNAHLNLTDVRELLEISSALSHALVPQEYGINVDEKIFIGSAMCRTLLSKINTDLDLARGLKPDVLKDHNTHRLNPSYAKKIKSAHRSVRTRLYFTSESHLHSLLNVLRYGREECAIKSPIGEESCKWIEDIPELCYMTHFVVRVFERVQYSLDDPQRFRVEISVSPGADQDPLNSDPEKQLEVAPLKIISHEGLTCQELVDYVADCIDYAEQNEIKEMISRTVASKGNGSSENTNGDSSSNSGDVTPVKRSMYSLSNNSSDSNFSSDN
ncbi:Inositol hexakisphosphate and diphosphoinositol-pentakisphosphate kinase [Phytophthora idaei]|nr:Inositol hexakisphosphate and diphosphoinositol-pentakisphosphate kinase [Phytophthora idaei]KAG3172448.1 Inositol hexakisphosphate and diphosphoinositol-pentakisphosphate kinase [Phytophthora idaei]KAG3253196.1 Inositol hexakisphosphate and diphosphoinositol-pentakisphosphate kinase [Phytophthora idaei]